jgi:hypothetical protein
MLLQERKWSVSSYRSRFCLLRYDVCPLVLWFSSVRLETLMVGPFDFPLLFRTDPASRCETRQGCTLSNSVYLESCTLRRFGI